MHQISAIENPAHRLDQPPTDFEPKSLRFNDVSSSKYVDSSHDGWYDELDELGEAPDDAALPDDLSDGSDFEETMSRRRSRKKVQMQFCWLIPFLTK